MSEILKIDNEFKNLIPPLTNDEYKQLEENVIKEGCRDSLVTWNETIIDGHNRYEICSKNNIKFKVSEMEFKTREDVIEWIIRNQFGRRNLPNYERAKLALRLKPIIAERAKDNQTLSGVEYGKGSTNSSEPIKKTDTRKELAKISGTSEDTIRKVEIIEKEGSEEIKEKTRKGEISVYKAFNLTRPKAEPLEEETKTCTMCNKEKPASEFKNNTNECKKCYADRTRMGLTVKQAKELNKEFPLDTLNKMYEDMKNPTSGNAEVGQNEKHIHATIITELEEILNSFNLKLKKFTDIDEIKTKKVTNQVNETIHTLKQLLI